MKYIFLILSIFFYINCFSQLDSSKSKISVTLVGKDVKYISLMFEKINQHEDIDSICKSKFRVQNPPNNNASVVIDSIEQRVWLHFVTRLSFDPLALHPANNVFSRVDAAVRLSGGAWIINKLNRSLSDIDSRYTDILSIGNKYLKKQED